MVLTHINKGQQSSLTGVEAAQPLGQGHGPGRHSPRCMGHQKALFILAPKVWCGQALS